MTKIVFTSDWDGKSEIFIMNVYGIEQFNLTNNSENNDLAPLGNLKLLISNLKEMKINFNKDCL